MFASPKRENYQTNFDDDEKVAHTMGTPGGKQEVTFLTEKGLYKLLGMSRKPIAEKFQDWMVEVQTNREIDIRLLESTEQIRHETLLSSKTNT